MRHIPTAFGRTLAHPVCSWYCAGDVHAILTAGPSESTPDDVRANAIALGLDVVEILPGREADLGLLRQQGEQFNGRRIACEATARQQTAWIVRCRVAIPREEEDGPES